MNGLTFEVRAIPSPQGSKRHVGHGVMVESAGQKLKDWRTAVRVDCVAAMDDTSTPPITGPVEVLITFLLPRPKSHYRANGDLKSTAPRWVDKRPDLDKLTRSTLDALTAAGVFGDDAQVVRLEAGKRYAHPQLIGATITLRPIA